MKQLLKRFDILFTIVLFILVIPAEYNELFSTLEDQFVSVRHVLRTSYADPEKTEFPKDKIALVVTDDLFFEDYGGFPFKRSDIGNIVEKISMLGAKVIMVDLIFDFPYSYEGEDARLAETLENAGNTLLVSMLELDGDRLKKINYPIPEIKEVTQTAYSNHYRMGNALNRLRLYPEIAKEHGEWPISVKTAAMYLGVEPVVKGRTLLLGNRKIKLDQFNDFRNDYPHLSAEFKYLYEDPFIGINAMDLLDVDLEDEEWVEEWKEEFEPLISGKIVFLGDISTSMHDKFTTAVGEVWGVEILANEVATLLRGAPLKSASLTSEIVVTILFVFLLILANLLQDPKFRALASVGVFIIYIVFCSLMYIYVDAVFSMSYILVAGILGFAVINIYLFVDERKQRSFITDAFGQYLSPDVIEALVEDPDKLSLGGERREMTAFFSDIQGFSTISESLTPDELVNLLNLYLTAMCDIISAQNGTIDKFEGDAIIAFWGAPIDQPNHAELSCFATIDMQKALVDLREEWIKEGLPLVLVRMGVNSGPMVVGNMGSQSRMDYTIMGDSVNLAARLEGANKFYKNFSMISEFTYDLAKDAIDVRELDTVRVVGKNEPITVYDLLERKGQTAGKKADLVEIYNKGLALYRDRNYADAIKMFESGLEIIENDGPSITYIDRCKRFIADPPADDWDGVYTHTEKG